MGLTATLLYSARVNSQVFKNGLGGGRLARQDMVSGRDAQYCFRLGCDATRLSKDGFRMN